jgi:hypothetical protein
MSAITNAAWIETITKISSSSLILPASAFHDAAASPFNKHQ